MIIVSLSLDPGPHVDMASELAERLQSVREQVEALERSVRQTPSQRRLLNVLQELRQFLHQLLTAEEALLERDARTQAILDTAVDGIITINERGIIESFNLSSERIFGYAAEEVIGRNVSMLMPPPDAKRHDDYVSNYLRTGERRIIGIGREVHGRRKDGSVFPMELAVGETYLGDRRLFTGIVRDIAARKRSERRISTHHAVTRVLASAGSLVEASPKLLEAISNGLHWDIGEIWHVDNEANVLRWDGMWHQPDFDPGAFAEESEKLALAIADGLPGRIWATGRAEWLSDLNAGPGLSRDSITARLGLQSAVAFPLLSDGAVIGVMAFFSRHPCKPETDVLEMLEVLGRQIGDFITRRRAEARLQQSERRFAEFMAHLPGVAFIKDASGRYLYANDTFQSVFRLEPEALLGKTDTDIWPQGFAAQFHANDRQVIETGSAVQTTELVPHDDGVHQWLVTKFPIFATDGSVSMVGGVAVDVTERRRAEAQLLEMEKLGQQRERLADIGAITAKLAHDLGNPLAAVSMQAQLIVRRAHRDPDQPLRSVAKAAEQILAEVGRLDALTKGLMTFAREQRLDVKRIPLRRFLQEIVDFWRSMASEHNISIAFDLAAGLEELVGDKEKLRRVMDNLIKNAVEAIDSGPGAVRITVIPEGEKVRITVADTGPGISESINVFKLFETTKSQGTGLGLSIARQIVNAHGGEIDIVRLQPKGTAFVVDLPARGSPL